MVRELTNRAFVTQLLAARSLSPPDNGFGLIVYVAQFGIVSFHDLHQLVPNASLGLATPPGKFRVPLRPASVNTVHSHKRV